MATATSAAMGQHQARWGDQGNEEQWHGGSTIFCGKRCQDGHEPANENRLNTLSHHWPLKVRGRELQRQLVSSTSRLLTRHPPSLPGSGSRESESYVPSHNGTTCADGPMIATSLQVALDTIDLLTAVRVATQVVDVVDRIEIGTPLLRRYGVRAIEVVRNHCKDAILVADFKTMDYGDLEARLAIDAGADGIIVQAAATRATLEAACNYATQNSAFVMVDGIGITDVADLERRVTGLDVKNVILHKAKDEQNRDGPLTDLLHINTNRAPKLPPLAVAGGITPQNVSDLLSGTDIDIIIVGSAIMTSLHPRVTAMMFMAALKRG
jgi:3-hexulose-6-phosphate synthase